MPAFHRSEGLQAGVRSGIELMATLLLISQ